ncbi:hypothetical protein FPRO04_13787 [Fusarium proliferatum]|nr:hypothetical protein FPRO04_13787 [Fusarium proliferatum]
MEEVQRSSEIATEAKAATKEATEIGKATMKMIRSMKLVNQKIQANAVLAYVNALDHYKLGDPIAIANIRAMSPSSLKSHVDDAIEQSSNEHVEKIKVVPSNQLYSGDLSIKAATAADMIAPRQFAEDWEQKIGNRDTVRIPTYSVLVHGVRTSSMDMDNFELIRDGKPQDNKPLIPNAEIKYRVADKITAYQISILRCS